MAHRYDEVHLTVSRQVSNDGVRRYLVWLRRGTATVVTLYEASSAEDAKRQAVAELEAFEALAHTI